MTKVLLFAALVACIAVPFRVFVKGEQTKHRYKTTLALNGVMFFGLMLFTGVMMFSGNAFAAETAETAAVAASSTATGLGYIAAALSIGMSCIGGQCSPWCYQRGLQRAWKISDLCRSCRRCLPVWSDHRLHDHW